MVREFFDVFPEELPRLPPELKIELSIEVQHSIDLISIPLYRMVPTELNELETQLKELLDKRFV